MTDPAPTRMQLLLIQSAAEARESLLRANNGFLMPPYRVAYDHGLWEVWLDPALITEDRPEGVEAFPTREQAMAYVERRRG